MPLAIKINPKDNVVVALRPITKGTAVPVDNTTVTAIEDIPQGHKMAIAPIKSGENVIKYGFPIGHATADAVPGTWMHTHNIHTNLSGEIEYSYHPNVHPLTPAAPETITLTRKEGSADSIRLMTGVKSPMRFTDSGNGHKVTVSFDESVFTNGVLWQQDAESFVCMEPWNGWANSVNEAGHHIELNPGESKEFKWSVTIG